MKPPSDFTTPRRLICPISRHFFPVEQPDPPVCETTGLKKGSRFPVIDHFFSSGFACLVASAVFPPSALLRGSDFLFASVAGLAAIGAAGFDPFPATFAVAGAGRAFGVGFAAGGLAANTALAAGIGVLGVAGPFAAAPGIAELLFAAGAAATLTAGFAVLAEAVAGLTAGLAALAGATAG